MGSKLLKENFKFLATMHRTASIQLVQCCQHMILHHFQHPAVFLPQNRTGTTAASSPTDHVTDT